MIYNLIIRMKKNLSDFNKIKRLGQKYLYNKDKEILIKIKNDINLSYIKNAFDVYKISLLQINERWNDKEKYYKKFYKIIYKNKYISENSISRDEDSIISEERKRNKISHKEEYYLYKYRKRIKRELLLNMTGLHLRMSNKMINTNIIIKNNPHPRRLAKTTITVKKKYGRRFSVNQNFCGVNLILDGIKDKNKNSSQSFENDLLNLSKRSSKIGSSRKSLSNQKKQYKIKYGTSISNSFNSQGELISDAVNALRKKREKMKEFLEEKEKKFNNINKILNNFNILTKKDVFQKKENNFGSIDIGEKFNKYFESKKKKRKLDCTYKKDLLVIKFAGMEQLTKEASLIKTQEIEKDLPDFKQFNKLVHAIEKRKIKLFESLVNSNQNFDRIINKQDVSTGNSLLIYAVIHNVKHIVELLLLRGIDPNIQNSFGDTALHLAYKMNSTGIVNTLIEFCADQKIKNNGGLYPWQMSKYING